MHCNLVARVGRGSTSTSDLLLHGQSRNGNIIKVRQTILFTMFKVSWVITSSFFLPIFPAIKGFEALEIMESHITHPGETCKFISIVPETQALRFSFRLNFKFAQGGLMNVFCTAFRNRDTRSVGNSVDCLCMQVYRNEIQVCSDSKWSWMELRWMNGEFGDEYSWIQPWIDVQFKKLISTSS